MGVQPHLQATCEVAPDMQLLWDVSLADGFSTGSGKQLHRACSLSTAVHSVPMMHQAAAGNDKALLRWF